MSIVHSRFEEEVYQAFPVLPIPDHPWPGNHGYQRELRALFAGHPWPEAVGWRLHEAELEVSLSTWLRALPLPVSCYYLPSHLLLASILLRGDETNYAHGVMEAFVLPPSHEPADLEEIDDEFALDASVFDYSAARMALHDALTKGQRRCVSAFLALYFDRHQADFTPRGQALFERNRLLWLDSSTAPAV